MNDVPYVSLLSARTAEDWELRFEKLPAEAGILFVSVKPRPVSGGSCSKFEVRLGIARDFEEATGLSLIKHVLAEEIESGRYEIEAAVYRGLPCRGSTSRRAAPGAHSS